jgi:aminotransferase
MVAEFKRRRDLVVPAINGIQRLSCLQPGGAFYVWVNVSRMGVPSEEFSIKLLEVEHVSSVPGEVFGGVGHGYVRFSYANSYERLEEAMRRLARFCA